MQKAQEFVNRLEEIKQELFNKFNLVSNQKEFEELKIIYLGRKGIFTKFIKRISEFPQEQRAQIGLSINKIKEEIQKAISKKQEEFKEKKEEFIDPTLQAQRIYIGRLHPITQILDEIVFIFQRLGFSLEEGPEMETTWHNFDALGIPKEHPARDMHDTFYLDNGLILRTHTSPVQIRVMQKRKPPLYIICPGAVYRRDADIRHSPFFHQVEGLAVDETISFCHLKGVLEFFAKSLFGENIKTRFRPSYFPFTEPSAEMDISCGICNGSGCSLCNNGWIEVLGCGMVAPCVFEAVGYDYEKYSGFAFGLGVERIAMIKYKIPDIRLFFQNDFRFLSMF